MTSTKVRVYFLFCFYSKLFVFLTVCIEEVYLRKRYLVIRWYFLSVNSIISRSLSYIRLAGYNSGYLSSFINLSQKPYSFNSASPFPNPRRSFCFSIYFLISIYLWAFSLSFLSSSVFLSSYPFFLF